MIPGAVQSTRPAIFHSLQFPQSGRKTIQRLRVMLAVLHECTIAESLIKENWSSRVGMATGILRPAAGMGSEKAPGAYGV